MFASSEANISIFCEDSAQIGISFRSENTLLIDEPELSGIMLFPGMELRAFIKFSSFSDKILLVLIDTLDSGILTLKDESLGLVGRNLLKSEPRVAVNVATALERQTLSRISIEFKDLAKLRCIFLA